MKDTRKLCLDTTIMLLEEGAHLNPETMLGFVKRLQAAEHKVGALNRTIAERDEEREMAALHNDAIGG